MYFWFKCDYILDRNILHNDYNLLKYDIYVKVYNIKTVEIIAVLIFQQTNSQTWWMNGLSVSIRQSDFKWKVIRNE